MLAKRRCLQGRSLVNRGMGKSGGPASLSAGSAIALARAAGPLEVIREAEHTEGVR